MSNNCVRTHYFAFNINEVYDEEKNAPFSITHDLCLTSMMKNRIVMEKKGRNKILFPFSFLPHNAKHYFGKSTTAMYILYANE